jgi:sec-independent protein translocase protein TatB
MFNIGGGELAVILLLALVFLGPERLPQAARQLGKFMAEYRRMAAGFKSELQEAIDLPDATMNDLRQVVDTVRNPLDAINRATQSSPPSIAPLTASGATPPQPPPSSTAPTPAETPDPPATSAEKPVSAGGPTDIVSTPAPGSTARPVVEGPEASFS